MIKDTYNSVSIHPLLKDRVNQEEESLNQFKSLLSNFKPKQSLLEYQIATSRDEAR